jgi:hypothetical protein
MVSRLFPERWQKGAMCAIALFAPEPMAKMRVARGKMKLVANAQLTAVWRSLLLLALVGFLFLVNN